MWQVCSLYRHLIDDKFSSWISKQRTYLIVLRLEYHRRMNVASVARARLAGTGLVICPVGVKPDGPSALSPAQNGWFRDLWAIQPGDGCS